MADEDWSVLKAVINGYRSQHLRTDFSDGTYKSWKSISTSSVVISPSLVVN